MKTVPDMSAWEEMKSGLVPLSKTHKKSDEPVRFRVYRKKQPAVSNVLDLHHKTVQEAYVCTQDFLAKHTRLGTKKIQIITGKGRTNAGVIRSEFEGWLDTPAFQKYVQCGAWTHDKGAINLCLKKHK